MNKVAVFLVALVSAGSIVVLGEYLHSNFTHLYQYLIWFVALIIAALVYMLFDKSMKPIYSTLHDRMTGLPNGHLLKENLDQAIAYASRNAQKVRILYLELKQFESIKDSYGDEAGESILIEVADRLHSSLRTSDIIAHIKTDVFVIIPRDIEEEKHFFQVVDKLTKAINEPIIIDGNSLSVEMN